MRYDADHKRTVRERLLENAARLVRKRGVSGTSVADVMGSAGMTVGGFYRHFASQDLLRGEALAKALRDARRRLFEGIDELRGSAFERAFVGRYLSTAHCADVARGCPIPATISEVSRLRREARTPLSNEIESIVEYVAQRIGHGREARARAITLLVACAGAVAVARAIGGELGDEVLRATRATLIGS